MILLGLNVQKMFGSVEPTRTKMFKGLVDKYSWVDIGSSFYPSELQAAFLLAQLEAIEQNRIRTKSHIQSLFTRTKTTGINWFI